MIAFEAEFKDVPLTETDFYQWPGKWRKRKEKPRRLWSYSL